MGIHWKRYGILFLVTTVAGVLLHFVYEWLPVWPVALFSSVNESLWEHVKLLFWPYLLASLYLHKKEGWALRPRLLCVLLMCAVMLGLAFWYHILLGGESMAADVCLYLLMMAGGFALPCFLQGPYEGRGWGLVGPLTVLLAGLIVLFTFWPPDHILFLDLTGANTWSQIPC